MGFRLQSLWRSWFRRDRVERELDDELRFHLDALVEANVRAGMAPEEARRQAQLELGRVEQVKEEVRAGRPGVFLETLWQDVRFGARLLRRNPGFTLVAVVTLALGIGANTAIFSVVKTVLLESLPYPHARRIAMIWDVGSDGARLDVAFGTYRELTERSRAFEAMAVMKPWQPTMTGAAQPERFDAQRVSAAYFRVLGVPPAIGRDFQPSDDRANGPGVVLLSDGLWRRRFGGDEAIIGRRITLDDASYEVLGVMPKGFENVVAPSAELWSPLQYDLAQGRAWGHHLRMIGRVRPGVGMEGAKRELDAIARTPLPEYPRPPWASLRAGFIVNSLQDDVTGDVRPALLAVLCAVVLVLAIACVNVTNLLLARGAQRRGEFAVRAALGGGRARMTRQLLTESLLLASLGGALGMLVADFGVSASVALSPAGLPRVDAIRLDGAVFAFGIGITTLIGLAFGLIPALQASRGDLYAAIQQSARRAAGSHQSIRRVLVVAEVALALVLLVSAGLLLRSVQSLFAVAPGFDASHLLTMQVQTSGHRFAEDGATRRFFAQALEAVRNVPGVTAAAFTSQLPLSGDSDLYGVHFDPPLSDDPGEVRGTFRYAVSPGYFEAMRIPLRRGRLLDEHDRSGAALVALISESMAKRRLPGVDLVGRRARIGNGPLYTIVGVVGDVKQMSLALNEADAVYVTADQWWFANRAMSLVVRTRGEAGQLAASVRDAIWSVDKDQPVVRVVTMDELLVASAADRRFAMLLFEAFALLALALAATGVYGVLSGSVNERIREIGVRMALGAQRGQIFRFVIGQGMSLALAGLALGVIGAAAVTRLLERLLFGVQPHDAATFVGVTLLLAGVALVACWIPARRATRVDPMVVLRYE